MATETNMGCQEAHVVSQDMAIKAVVVPHFLDAVVLEKRLESLHDSFLLLLRTCHTLAQPGSKRWPNYCYGLC